MDNLTLAQLSELPKRAQMLTAHCLDHGDPNLTLLANDTDASTMISDGWLTSVPCSTIGLVRFAFEKPIWRQLKSLQMRFLTEEILRQVKSYRVGKSAQYPWVWW